MREKEFSEKIHNYKEQLYFIAYTILKNEADTEDAVSNAILKGYEHIDELKNPQKFKAWMITITKNEALQLKRKQLNLPGNEKVEAMLSPVQDNYNELWDVVQELKEEYRLVIVLFYYNHLSIKEIAQVLNIPTGTVKSRLSRGKELLRGILDEKEPQVHRNEKRSWAKVICLIACVILISVLGLTIADRGNVEAGFFEEFKKTIMDLLNLGEEESAKLGIESEKTSIVSKQDLLIELKETIIDKQNIYLLVQVTAPVNVHFTENISFDYFAFCKGDNYNSDALIGGATECRLLEVLESSDNKATYVVSLLSGEELEKDSNITVCFRNLMADPWGDAPEMLVEGMWNITFPVHDTVTEDITVEGTGDMEFSYINTTAVVESIQITPLGMVMLVDISNFPYEDLGISDTTIAVRFQMIDGSELVVISHDWEEETIVSGAGSSFEEETEGNYMRNDYEFSEPLDISKIVGIYIEDLYIPLK